MASSQLPYKIKEVTEEEDKVIKKYYKDIAVDKPFIRIGPSGEYLMTGYREFAKQIYNLEVRPDDIWVVTFPRSGTTWTQEMTWLILNNLDFDTAQSTSLNDRYTYLEFPTHKTLFKARVTKDCRNMSEQASPRYIKTHVPLSLLPKTLLDTAKVFYVARDPRDVAVSYHFLHKLFRNFDDSVIRADDSVFYVALDPRDVAVSYYFLHKLYRNFDDSVLFREFWDLFQKDLIKNTPIFPHIKEAWEKRNHPNMMFLFYEDMQTDFPGIINCMCKFLGKEYTDEQKQQLAKYLEFGNMKKKDILDRPDNEEIAFFRKGKSGNWVQYLDEEMTKEAEEFMEKNLKETDMRFPNN